MSGIETDRGSAGESLRELLARHDGLVEKAMDAVGDTSTGTSRVQALHLLRRAVTAHDSVVGSTLCPLLEDLPGGPEVAARLRQGCEERQSLLARFQSLSEGTEARNVYPVFGAEIEALVAELRRSFHQHVDDETTLVSELLESAAGSVSPATVAARIAIEANRAPARAHRATHRHPRSRTLRAIYRGVDRLHDWNDSHHGWPGRTQDASSRPVRPGRRQGRRPPSVPELLSEYDRAVEAVIAELAASGADTSRRASAAYELGAAVAVHDAMVAGTVCRVLDAVPEGRDAAVRMRQGCEARARLLERWDGLTAHTSPADLFETHPDEANQLIEGLIADFRAHETTERADVAAVVERLRTRPWKYRGTASPNLMGVWPNPEPGVLAAHMALWADKAPTHPHAVLSRHPGNRLLRNLLRYRDRVEDRRRARHGWPRIS